MATIDYGVAASFGVTNVNTDRYLVYSVTDSVPTTNAVVAEAVGRGRAIQIADLLRSAL